MELSKMSRLILSGVALSSSVLTGCIFVGELDDVYEPVPKAITYEVCYSSSECYPGDTCEELALPADRYTDYVNAICTYQCFDDLDCLPSAFNGLPGACVDHVYLGGFFGSRICLERCEVDIDCDIGAGFGCELIDGERLCVPIR